MKKYDDWNWAPSIKPKPLRQGEWLLVWVTGHTLEQLLSIKGTGPHTCAFSRKPISLTENFWQPVYIETKSTCSVEMRSTGIVVYGLYTGTKGKKAV